VLVNNPTLIAFTEVNSLTIRFTEWAD